MSLATNSATVRLHDKGGIHRGLTSPEDASLQEILDRLLDHGIIIDPYSRIHLLGMDAPMFHERFVIDWRDTYF